MLLAAVIIPIVRHPDPTIVFVRRAAHLRRNPGQIGFPGGLIDASDLDSQAAALREFEEELGVPRERVQIADRLEDVVTLSLSVTVTPFLAFLDPPISFAADPSETQSIHEIPLAALYAAGALHEGIEHHTRHGLSYEIPSWLFDHDGIHVWGATARMLHTLVARYDTVERLLLQSRAP